MFISATNQQNRDIAKTSFIYLLVTIFSFIFGAVYEQFSHGVYSGYMIYAFAIPLVGGVLPFFLMYVFKSERTPGRLPLNLYNSGIATLIVGSIFKGILEIYGTSNDLVRIYWFFGFGLAGFGIIIYLIGLLIKKYV